MWDQVPQPTSMRLTMALLHFLWQGLAIALVWRVALPCIGPRRTRLRYWVSVFALAVMAGCPVITFWLMPTTNSRITQDEPATGGFLPISASNTIAGPAEQIVPTNRAVVSVGSLAFADRVFQGVTRQFAAWNTPSIAGQPFVLLAWLAGVCVFSLKLAGGIAGAIWLTGGRRPIHESLAGRAAEIGRKLRISTRGRLFASTRVAEAACVGFWRPVVLIPAAWLLQLPTDVLDAVIAHELAHLRRCDPWVNLLQRLIETALFYHPAVWWVSKRIRLEREMCCDELAVFATEQPAAYARALEHVARLNMPARSPAFATAFRGEKRMKLLHRVRNVLGVDSATAQRGWWPIGLSAVILPVAAWVVASGLAPLDLQTVQADDDRVERRDDRDRDGDKRNQPRDGDRDRAEHRDGDRNRGEHDGGFRPRGPVGRDQGRSLPPKDAPRNRDDRRPEHHIGDRPRDSRDHHDGRPGAPPEESLLRVVRELQDEVRKLRHEVEELKQNKPSSREGNFDRRPSGRRFSPPFRNGGERPRGPFGGPPGRVGPREGGGPRDSDRPHPRSEGPSDRDQMHRPGPGPHGPGGPPPQRGFGPRDGGPRDEGPRDGGPRDGGPREEGAQDRRPEGNGRPAAGPRDGGRGPGRDSRRDGDHRDGGPGHDGPGHGGPGHDGPRDAGPRGDGPRDRDPRGDGPDGAGPGAAGPRDAKRGDDAPPRGRSNARRGDNESRDGDQSRPPARGPRGDDARKPGGPRGGRPPAEDNRPPQGGPREEQSVSLS